MAVFLLSCFMLAQDLDVALNGRSRPGATILDQIESAPERQAFLDLYREPDPVARRSKASAFLRTYPSSWLLAQVTEAAARASFDLGDTTTGLYFARQSLELYPENPLLLATLAAVRANRHEPVEAKRDARATLEALAKFQPPANMKDRDWSPVRERLRATALRVLGPNGEMPEVAKLPPDPKAAYAGSEACRTCHAAQFASWSQTGMAKMLRPATAEGIMADFTTLGNFAEFGQLVAKGFEKDGRFFVDLRRTAGRGTVGWDRYPIDYTIGSKWQQAYATRAPDGDLHVIPLQYNRLEKSWLNYWRQIDPPGSERVNVGEFHRLRDVTSYQQNCAPCHTSQLQPKGFLEAGVNCEMCHGPSAEHARGGAPAFKFQQVDNRRAVQICAQCHAQSAIRTPQGFPPQYQRRPYAEFSRKAFYRDGRFRETTFIVEAFERSKCFQQGTAHCGSCHDPHPANAANNPTSLKYLDQPDRMCTQCHDARYSAKSHTQHSSGEASRCVSCHMPKIMNSLLFKARSHQIDDRPKPEMTLRFGNAESPNACLECHSTESVTWVRDQLKQRWVRTDAAPRSAPPAPR
ncbi:MAG: multiheme c-type cytochrome [Acidobacteria bacterium]|nr:multiheme c-type cytochrome [Acidobacteriota bacterium]